MRIIVGSWGSVKSRQALALDLHGPATVRLRLPAPSSDNGSETVTRAGMANFNPRSWIVRVCTDGNWQSTPLYEPPQPLHAGSWTVLRTTRRKEGSFGFAETPFPLPLRRGKRSAAYVGAGLAPPNPQGRRVRVRGFQSYFKSRLPWNYHRPSQRSSRDCRR